VLSCRNTVSVIERPMLFHTDPWVVAAVEVTQVAPRAWAGTLLMLLLLTTTSLTMVDTHRKEEWVDMARIIWGTHPRPHPREAEAVVIMEVEVEVEVEVP